MRRPAPIRRLLPVVMTMVIGCAGLVPAAEHTPIAIDALVALARAHTPAADRVAADQALAAAAVREAGAWRNPELEVAGGRARFREEGGTTGIGSVSVTQPLPSPWRRSAALAVARAGLPQAEAAATLVWLELELAVREAAADHAMADEALQVALTAAQAATAMRTAVAARARAGEAGLAEQARAQAEESHAQLLVGRRRGEVLATRAILASWCGPALPDDPRIDDAIPVRFPVLDRDALIRTACDNGPRLRLLAEERRQRQADLTAQQRAWHPDLSVGAGLNREADSDSWEVTLGIELPLWNRQGAAADRAAAALMRSDAELRTVRNEIERTVIAAWNAYDRERLQCEAIATITRPAAAEARRLTQTAFQGGTATFADLVETQRAELRCDDEALAARRAAIEAWLRLAAATGDCRLGSKDTP